MSELDPPVWHSRASGYQAWGAFYGTELDLQLRRRGIRTIVLGGVSTHIGVESTARQAYEHGYELLIVKDATTSSVAEGHEMSMKHILPRLGRLVQGGDLTFTRHLTWLRSEHGIRVGSCISPPSEPP